MGDDEKEGKDVQGAKNEGDREKIDSGWGLIRFCLKSKSFDLLLVIMMGFVWCGIILLRVIVSGGDSTESLIAIYIWPVLILSFFAVMFSIMRAITKERRKNIVSVIGFTFIMLFIPILMIVIL